MMNMAYKNTLIIFFTICNFSICLSGRPRLTMSHGDLKVTQDKLTVIYQNTEYVDVSVNITNPGKLEATSNSFITLKKTPPANILLKIFPLRAENGKFDTKGKTPVRHNICQYIKQDKILYPGFIKYGNLPRSCPIKVADYYVKNYKVPVDSLPPVVPPGKYKLIFDIGNDNVKILNIEWEGTVSN